MTIIAYAYVTIGALLWASLVFFYSVDDRDDRSRWSIGDVVVAGLLLLAIGAVWPIVLYILTARDFLRRSA